MTERESLLDQFDNDWSAAIARKEREVMGLIAHEYERATRQLFPLWEEAYAKLWQARAEGRTGDDLAGFIWQEQRMAYLINTATERYRQVAGYVGDTITPAMAQYEAVAQQSIAMQTQLAFAGAPEGFSYPPFRFPTRTFEGFLGRLEMGSPLEQLLLDRFGASVDVARDTLLWGVAQGLNPREVRRQLAQNLSGHYGKLDVMVRTEMLGAYRKSTSDTLKENAHLLRGWRWSASISTRTCAMCWALHGQEFPLDEPMATHPACRCSMRPIVKPWGEVNPLFAGIEAPKEKTGIQLFAELDEGSQRQILGPLAFKAYQGKHIRLDDLVEETWSDVWGRGRRRKGLSRILPPDRYRQLKAGTLPPRQRLPKRPRVTPKALAPQADQPAGPDLTKPLRPKGTPVSEALNEGLAKMPKRGASGEEANRLRKTAELIDQTHGDGTLQPLPTKFTSSQRYWGQYRYYQAGYGSPARPDSISIARGGSHQHMTYAHEAGHFIDQQWLGRHFGAERYGRDMYASKHADRIPELQRWHQAVKGSRAYQQLTELAQLGKARQTVKMVVNGSERDIIPDRTYLRYVMTDHELFARSYSQYIATKSQYPPMLAELERERDPSRSAYHATQWADDDFEPIAEAFDDLFEQLGGLGRD